MRVSHVTVALALCVRRRGERSISLYKPQALTAIKMRPSLRNKST